MRTAKKAKNKLPPTTEQYKPEDLEAMRQAFICACHENPDVAATEAQRYDHWLIASLILAPQLLPTQLPLLPCPRSLLMR